MNKLLILVALFALVAYATAQVVYGAGYGYPAYAGYGYAAPVVASPYYGGAYSAAYYLKK